MLSGGELQRLACSMTIAQDVNVYIFDEPSSFLDLKQRISMSVQLQKLLIDSDHKCYIMVVEHDLTVLSLVSDGVCCLYGEPGAYGVCSTRAGTRAGINQFLAGFLPADNMRFRANELTFWASAPQDATGGAGLNAEAHAEGGGGDAAVEAEGGGGAAAEKKEKKDGKKKKGGKKGKDGQEEEETKVLKSVQAGYPAMVKRHFGVKRRGPDASKKSVSGEDDPIEMDEKPSFELVVDAGQYSASGQVCVLLGENGTGKSTFIDMLADWLVNGNTKGETHEEEYTEEAKRAEEEVC
jgi:translation initiation factor RLI1